MFNRGTPVRMIGGGLQCVATGGHVGRISSQGAELVAGDDRGNAGGFIDRCPGVFGQATASWRSLFCAVAVCLIVVLFIVSAAAARELSADEGGRIRMAVASASGLVGASEGVPGNCERTRPGLIAKGGMGRARFSRGLYNILPATLYPRFSDISSDFPDVSTPPPLKYGIGADKNFSFLIYRPPPLSKTGCAGQKIFHQSASGRDVLPSLPPTLSEAVYLNRFRSWFSPPFAGCGAAYYTPGVSTLLSSSRGISLSKKKLAAADMTKIRHNDEVRNWAAMASDEWGEVLNWNAVWLDTETGELVDFMQIRDENDLIAASQRAERQWLDLICEKRAAYLERFDDHGQEQALRQFERHLCKESLYYLCKYVLGYRDMVFHLHYYMAASVENLEPGYRGLREYARDSFKSTVLTIGFCVQRVIREPDVTILIKSNQEGNAAKKLQEAKHHFLTRLSAEQRNLIAANRKKETVRWWDLGLQELFPEHYGSSVASRGTNTYWRTPATVRPQKEGTMEAAGVGTSKTSQHYDIIVGDDFWDQKSVTSLEVSTKVNKELSELEYLFKSPRMGIGLFVGTRFAHDDPTSRFVDSREYHCIIVSGIVEGRSIFPENLTLEKFYDQAHNDLYVFTCQIMLNPTREGQKVKSEWFRYLKPSEMLIEEDHGEIKIRRIIMTDWSGSDNAGSDQAALMVILIDSQNRKLVAEYHLVKQSPLEFMRLVFGICDKWSVPIVYFQKSPLEVSMESFWNEMNRERSLEGRRVIGHSWISIQKMSKKARMRASLGPLQQGLIFFNPLDEQQKELESEFLAFPDTNVDHGMDCLAGITNAEVGAAPGQPKAKREEDNPRETVREMAQAAKAGTLGRGGEDVYKYLSQNRRKRGKPGRMTA